MESSEELNYFDVRLKPDERRNLVWKKIVQYLCPWIFSDARIVEVGAGYCNFINAVSGKEKYALDATSIVNTHAGAGVKPVVGSVTDLNMFSDNSMDVVLASNLFEHLSDDEFDRAIHEIFRILRIGGRLIIMQPNFYYAFRDYFHDYTHKKIFTHIGISNQLESVGFGILKVMPRFMPFSMASTHLPTPGWIIWCYLRSPWKPFAGQMLVIAEKK